MRVVIGGAGVASLEAAATLRVRFPKALTLHEGAAAPVTELVSEITSGGVRSVAFVAPERMAWPLPLYETALMTAALGREHRLSLRLTLVTGEAEVERPVAHQEEPGVGTPHVRSRYGWRVQRAGRHWSA